MSNTTKFHGVHTALVTTFNNHDELDLGAFTELISLQKSMGINGFVIAGSTGEAPTLSWSERVLLVKQAKSSCSSEVIIAGAGSNSTKHAIELQKAMEHAGADATLQVVPYYNKPSQDGLVAHFSAIAEQARVPIILYNAFGRTGIDMSVDTAARLLSSNENIIGIKEANPNINRLGELIAALKKVRSEAVVLGGEDTAFLPFLALGADGIISVASHVATSEMLAIYQSLKMGDLKKAQKIAHQIHGLCKLLFSHSNPIPIKTLLWALGLIKKFWRLPLCPLLEHEEAEFLAACRQFGDLSLLKMRRFAHE